MRSRNFARRWADLVNRHGGTYNGCYLPAGTSNDRALALFSFPSLVAFERYQSFLEHDPDFVEVDRIRDESDCVLWCDRILMRPLSMDTSDRTGG